MPAALRAHSVGRVMPTFLIESYMPGPDRDPDAVAVALGESASEGHRWSLLLPEEDMCFHVLDGESAEAVRDMALRAGLRCDRITKAVPVPARHSQTEGGQP